MNRQNVDLGSGKVSKLLFSLAHNHISNCQYAI